MWKFVIVLIFTASAASPLKVTPEELHTHFDAIQNSMRQQQSFYIGNEYLPIWASFNRQLINTKLNLTSEMLPYLLPYEDAVNEILTKVKGKKVPNQGTDELECVQAVNEKFTNVSDDIITKTITNLTEDVDQFLTKLNKYILTLDDKFEDLEQEVLACNDTSCATDLDATLDKLSAKVEAEMNELEEEMQILIDEINELHVDESYGAQIQSLIDELHLCEK